MFRISIVAASLSLALVGMGPTYAFAQGTAPSTELPRSPDQLPARAEPGGDGIAANGRCGGISDGTGERRCGDQAGGPSGGNYEKN